MQGTSLTSLGLRFPVCDVGIIILDLLREAGVKTEQANVSTALGRVAHDMRMILMQELQEEAGVDKAAGALWEERRRRLSWGMKDREVGQGPGAERRTQLKPQRWGRAWPGRGGPDAVQT